MSYYSWLHLIAKGKFAKSKPHYFTSLAIVFIFYYFADFLLLHPLSTLFFADFADFFYFSFVFWFLIFYFSIHCLYFSLISLIFYFSLYWLPYFSLIFYFSIHCLLNFSLSSLIFYFSIIFSIFADLCIIWWYTSICVQILLNIRSLTKCLLKWHPIAKMGVCLLL